MIDETMKLGSVGPCLFLFVITGCGGNTDDRHDCYSTSKALNQLCDAFNDSAGPLKFVIDEEFGPINVSGEISAEGSGASESLQPQGHLMIDIHPQSNEFYLSGIHIELSDFQKGVG